MKLSVWAKEQGISYRTAWRWFKLGKLPVPAKQLPSGTIILETSKDKSSLDVAIYAQVSSLKALETIQREN